MLNQIHQTGSDCKVVNGIVMSCFCFICIYVMVIYLHKKMAFGFGDFQHTPQSAFKISVQEAENHYGCFFVVLSVCTSCVPARARVMKERTI